MSSSSRGIFPRKSSTFRPSNPSPFWSVIDEAASFTDVIRRSRSRVIRPERMQRTIDSFK